MQIVLSSPLSLSDNFGAVLFTDDANITVIFVWHSGVVGNTLAFRSIGCEFKSGTAYFHIICISLQQAEITDVVDDSVRCLL